MMDMKKIILIILTAFLIAGCSKSKEYDAFGQEITPDPVSDEEKIVTMINECINTYNNDKVIDVQEQYSTTLPALPLELTTLPIVENYSQLIKEETIGTNADHVMTLPINDKYSLQFQLYEPLNSVWLDSKFNFLVDIDQIIKDDPTFDKEKNILDELLAQQEEAINLLYGSGITLGNQYPQNENYYEVQEYHSIDEIKAIAEKTFTQEYLDTLYDIAFYQDNPIYIEDNGRLYATESSTSISAGIPYNTSYIIAVSYDNDQLLIDVAAGYGDDIMPQIYRITLADEGNGYRLTNSY